MRELRRLLVALIVGTTLLTLLSYSGTASFHSGLEGWLDDGQPPHWDISRMAASVTMVLLNTVLIGAIVWLIVTKGDDR